MGRNIGYMNSSTHPASLQQQIEAGSLTAIGDVTSTRSPTVEELSLSLEAVTRKVSVIEGRMSVLEASFNILLQKTAELREELRLTHELLAMRNESLELLEQQRSRNEDHDSVEEAERVRLGDLGER